MKKIIFSPVVLLLLLTVTFVFFSSARSGNDNTTPVFSRPLSNAYADACIQKYKDVYSNPGVTDLPFIQQAYSHTVLFEKNGDDPAGPVGSMPLQDWIQKVSALPGYTHMAVCLGVYVDPQNYTLSSDPATDARIKKYIVSKLNRLTIFFRPWITAYTMDAKGKRSINAAKSGPLKDPGDEDSFNLGDLQP